MSTAKAWIYTTPGYPQTLRLDETQVPAEPSPHHVLIHIKANALNPVDIQLMNLFINAVPGFRGPKIAGRDFSGVVLAAAPGTAFNKGDEVMGVTLGIDGSGALVEVAHLDTRSSCIVKKPSHMTWNQAASLPLVWLTAYTAIEKCAPFMKKSPAGENKIAILGGSSSTGIYSIWLARQRGWKVFTSCSGRNRDFVKQKGAEDVMDYTTSPDAVTSTVAGFKPDAIIDCVGGTECIGLAPQYVTIVGDKTSRASIGGSILYYSYPRMYMRWLLGYVGWGNSYECIILQTEKTWLEKAGELGDRDIVIDSVFEFGEVKDAFERLDTGRARGKVVVSMVWMTG
ncbi:Uu.00g121270.m01.CDS01 [Anthostomella pinea]|uniref:Uu.00g121270.m01.CDS01 n=1 Tax=Anthostomella pinea TaxID=933095 RepID=A0AAI8VGW5_9PEZI|nr:Uu.00g121270.m01.CDS01 [Anthostomella pinea]